MTAALLLALAAGTTIDAASALPTPPAESTGAVPLTEPIAPVPHGAPDWSIGVSVLGGVADPFYDKVVAWLSARRGFGPLAAEVFGGRSFAWANAAISLCSTQTQCSSPAASRLGDTPGDLGWLGGASLVWHAAEGKIALAGWDAPFGVELSLGAAVVGYDIVSQSLVAPAGRGAVGIELHFPHSVGVRLDIQDIFYTADIRGDRTFENQLLAGGTVSLGFGGR